MVCDLISQTLIADGEECLNPCFNGIWSATAEELFGKAIKSGVLILVLMEYGLRPYVDLDETLYYLSVLILVLMEYGLRHY